MRKEPIQKRSLVEDIFRDILLTEEEIDWRVEQFDRLFRQIPKHFQEVLRLMYTDVRGSRKWWENTTTNIASKVKNLQTGKKGVTASTVDRRFSKGCRLLRKEYETEIDTFRETFTLNGVNWKDSFHALLSQSGQNRHEVRFLSQQEFDNNIVYRQVIFDWLNHTDHKQESLTSDYFLVAVHNDTICFLTSMFTDLRGYFTNGISRVYGYVDDAGDSLYSETFKQYVLSNQRVGERIRLNKI